MPINGTGSNGFPQQLLNIFEQQNYLQTFIRNALLPTYVFRPHRVGANDYFQGRVGETKTFTRRALIAPNTVPLNPANNSGLDNGMTGDQRSFEQWTAKLNEWSGFTPTNIYGQEAMLGDLFLDNQLAEAQKAGNSLEIICAQRIFNAYDSGDTFVTTAVSGGTIHVDNVNGFVLQFPQDNLPNYQTPAAVTSNNKMPIAVVSGSTGLITYLTNVNAYSIDAADTSYMQIGSQQFGNSGTLTLDETVNVAVGDRVVALDPAYATAGNGPVVGGALNPVWKDGSYVVRPLNGSGAMLTTAYAMGPTNIMNPSVMLPYAVSVLARRGVPKLRNGLYGCAIDSTLLAQFYQDTGFQRATMAQWDKSPVFKDGVIAAGWGVEFVASTQVPNYGAPNGGFQLRHAFVFGDEVISEHPFMGALNAADTVAGVGDIADERWVDRIRFRSLAAIDTLGQVIKIAYDYIGDFVPGTDKSSNPNIVLTTDYARYKRGVLLQAASQF